jgi:hypothetical protein
MSKVTIHSTNEITSEMRDQLITRFSNAIIAAAHEIAQSRKKKVRLITLDIRWASPVPEIWYWVAQDNKVKIEIRLTKTSTSIAVSA